MSNTQHNVGPLFQPTLDNLVAQEETGTYHEERTARCDVCECHKDGRLYYHNGTPVLFMCHDCD